MGSHEDWKAFSFKLSNEATKTLDRKDDDIDVLNRQLEQSKAQVAVLRNLCERLQHCAQGFYLDQGDYGHMEAIMIDYHGIMRESGGRKEADKAEDPTTWRVEDLPVDHPRYCRPFGTLGGW